MPTSNFATAAEKLTEALQLALPPIAISMTNGDLPEGIPTVGEAAPAGCLFWERAAAGPFVTSTRDHELCAVGVHTHSMAEPSERHAADLGDTLEAMAGLGYVRPEDVAEIPTLPNPVRHVVYAPLAEAPLAPDVVLLFAHAKQSLVITEAVQQVDPEMPPALGRPACAIVPQAMNSGRAALSLGCCGARAYLDSMTDDVAIWALPGARLDEYVERLTALAEANRVLGRFHELRRADVAAGGRPSVAESLERLGADA
jgi:uncharacterized protein (DUF169 family)